MNRSPRRAPVRLPLRLTIAALLAAALGVSVAGLAWLSRTLSAPRLEDYPPRERQLVLALASETYAESLENLVESSQYDEHFFHSTKGADHCLRDTLRSRRPRKVLAEIAGRPADDARRMSRELFDYAFGRLQATVDRVLRHRADPSAPANTESLLGDQAAVALGLFCVAHFCGVGELTDCLDAVDAHADAAVRRVQPGPASASLRLVIDGYSRPDQASRISLLMHALERHEAHDRVKLARAAAQVRGMESRRLFLTRWDAKPAPRRPKLRHDGAPADRGQVFLEATVYSWTSDRYQWPGGCDRLDAPCQALRAAEVRQAVLGEPIGGPPAGRERE